MRAQTQRQGNQEGSVRTTGRCIITLSGVVGAGKSTAAKAIVARLRATGLNAVYVRFQDLTAWRKSSRRSGAKSKGQENASAGDRTRWTGYRRRRLSLRLAAGYLLRTLLFRVRLRRWPQDTILVFDRYFYDSIVHFEPGNDMVMAVLLRSIPSPRHAVLLMIRPPTILQRRPDYATEYAEQVSLGYRAFAARIPGAVVIQTEDFGAVENLVDRLVAETVSAEWQTGRGIQTPGGRG